MRGRMKKYSKSVVNLAIALAILLIIVFLLPKALMFFLPFVVGWIIALMASPLVRFFEEKLKIKRKIGSAFVIIAVIAVVVLLIYFVCAWLAEQVGGLIEELPDMWAGMEADLDSMGKSLSTLLSRLPGETEMNLNNLAATLGNYVGEALERMGTPTIEAAGSFAMQLPSIFIGVIMALLSAYLFVAERQQINEWFRKHTPAVFHIYYNMIRRSLIKSVGGYLKAQLKIEVWMYVLLVVGLGVLGVNYYALIALGIAILDFIPFLGTGTVLIPWAVIKIFAADYKTAVGLLIIWCVGQLARQLIQPKIVGDSIGVPPIPTLLLLYIGYQVGGVIGMIVAVPIGLLVYTMYQEGAFDSVKNSVLILVAGVNRFRRLGKEDLLEVDEMILSNEEAVRKADIQRLEDELERKARYDAVHTDRHAARHQRKGRKK